MTGRREAMESATENIPPMAGLATRKGGKVTQVELVRKHRLYLGDQVRLKWRGKSSPRWWQHQWQGKPHPEQDQICWL
jgi:hypothetical protein